MFGSLLSDGEGWEIYNPQDDSWTFLEWDADVLRNIAKFRCVGVGSKLYFLGGQRGGAFRKEVYVYDLAQARCVDGRRFSVATFSQIMRTARILKGDFRPLRRSARDWPAVFIVLLNQ